MILPCLLPVHWTQTHALQQWQLQNVPAGGAWCSSWATERVAGGGHGMSGYCVRFSPDAMPFRGSHAHHPCAATLPSPKVTPLPKGKPASNDWSRQEHKRPASLPQFATVLKSHPSSGPPHPYKCSAKVSLATIIQANFLLCPILLPHP